MYYLKTLGELAVYRADERDEAIVSNSKPLVLLSLLATTPRHTARRDYLAELLWPGTDHSRARRSLRQALFYLSKHLEEPVVSADDVELALNDSKLQVDVWEFDRAMEVEDYARALELYDGRFLTGNEDKAGVEVEHWIDAQNARIQVGLEVAYGKLVSDALAKGEVEDAVRYARGYAELNPLNEQAQIVLVRALKAAGDDVAALAAYQAYRTLLQKELEEEPPEDLQAAMERVRDSVLELPAYTPIEVAAPEPEASAAEAGVGAASDGPEALAAGEGGRRASRLRRVAPFAAIGLGIVVTVATVTLLARVFLETGSAEVDPLAAVSGHFYATVGESDAARLANVSIDAGKVSVEPLDLSASELPSPDGHRIAFTQRAPDGWNLAVRDVTSGDVRVLTRRPGDEYPEAWSPDGQHIFYSAGTLLSDGRSYAYEPRVYDLATGADRRVSRFESGRRIPAAWSPDGTRIAFVADIRGRSEVFVVDFDGENVWDVSNSAASDADPAWSLDGSRIAFVSDREDTRDVYTARPNGTDLRRVTSAEGDAGSPIWTTGAAIVFVSRRGRSSDLWVADVTTGQVRRLTGRGDITSIRTGLLGGRRTWIERVAIVPRVEVGSPGEYLDLDVRVTDGAGDTLPPDQVGVSWSLADSQVAEIVEPGLVRLKGTGPSGIIASTRGWRADTLIVTSIPLVEREALAPVFVEDWKQGLDTARWILFGEPSPSARAKGGPDGTGVFDNGGDAHFVSGALTRSTFPLDSGIAVSAYGRMRFTGKVAQRFGLALYPLEPGDSTGWVGTRPIVEFDVQGRAGDQPAEAWLATTDARSPIPLPERTGEWHAYTLQVTPEGVVEVVIDGKLHWRSTRRVEATGAVRVGLGYQSFETQILHGPVHVYPRPRYFLLDLSPDSGVAESPQARAGSPRRPSGVGS